jgi:hypothetical protein
MGSGTVAWTARGDLGGGRLPRHGPRLAFNPAPIFLDPLFVADCYTLLGQAKPAEHHARQFIAQAALAGSRDYWPIRIASSRMDLGFALLQQHRIDEAAAEAAQGLDVFILNRGTLRRASELDRALAAFGEVPEVRDFHERLEKAWRQLTAC